jgi:hypothetical protein
MESIISLLEFVYQCRSVLHFLTYIKSRNIMFNDYTLTTDVERLSIIGINLITKTVEHILFIKKKVKLVFND